MGKWHLGDGNGEGYIFADRGRMRMDARGTSLYPICKLCGGWDEAEDAANARLIAAAPDLLAALKLAMRYLEHPDVQAIPFALPAAVAADRALAAIERATTEAEALADVPHFVTG